MRADWNERAGEDANYYVAFCRREQDDEEFFSTGSDIVKSLELDLSASAAACGARNRLRPDLMRPSEFRKIHGWTSRQISAWPGAVARYRAPVQFSSDLAIFPTV